MAHGKTHAHPLTPGQYTGSNAPLPPAGNAAETSTQQTAAPIARPDVFVTFSDFMLWPFYLFERTLNIWGEFAFKAQDSAAARRDRPSSDHMETASGYTYRVDLPGIDRERLSLHVEKTSIILLVQAPPSPGGDVVLAPQRRAFSIPVYADSNAVSASLTDGVLTITIPKMNRKMLPHPHNIDIK